MRRLQSLGSSCAPNGPHLWDLYYPWILVYRESVSSQCVHGRPAMGRRFRENTLTAVDENLFKTDLLTWCFRFAVVLALKQFLCGNHKLQTEFHYDCTHPWIAAFCRRQKSNCYFPDQVAPRYDAIPGLDQ